MRSPKNAQDQEQLQERPTSGMPSVAPKAKSYVPLAYLCFSFLRLLLFGHNPPSSSSSSCVALGCIAPDRKTDHECCTSRGKKEAMRGPRPRCLRSIPAPYCGSLLQTYYIPRVYVRTVPCLRSEEEAPAASFSGQSHERRISIAAWIRRVPYVPCTRRY